MVVMHNAHAHARARADRYDKRYMHMHMHVHTCPCAHGMCMLHVHAHVHVHVHVYVHAMPNCVVPRGIKGVFVKIVAQTMYTSTLSTRTLSALYTFTCVWSSATTIVRIMVGFFSFPAQFSHLVWAPLER